MRGLVASSGLARMRSRAALCSDSSNCILVNRLSGVLYPQPSPYYSRRCDGGPILGLMTRWVFSILFLFSLPASAALYRMSFAGTVTSGTTNSIEHPARVSLAGLSIFGSIDYELGLMPAPVVSSPPAGFASGVGTLFSSTTDPVWVVRQTIAIPGFPVLGGFTSPMEFPVVPVPVTGTEHSPKERVQELVFEAKGDSLVRANANFVDDWVDGTLVRRRGSQLGFLLTAPGPVLAETPGIQPFAFSGPGGGGGSFSFSEFEWNTVNSFFTTNNDLLLSFTVTSSQGEFVVPEPATWMLTAAALLALAVRRR